MTKIKLRNGESFEQALRRFNREVHKSGVLKEYRNRERFEKPSAVKRLKNKEKARKIKMSQRRNFR